MPTVLLIDDSSTIQKVAALILKGTPYKLISAKSFDEGENLARQQAPDLALVDYTIGKQNGLEVIKRFSNDPQLKMVKTALLYGHHLNVSDKSIESAGGSAKLAKPFDASEFLEMLERLTNAKVEPQNVEIETVVKMPDDEFKSLFDDDELEECLNFLEKPLTSEAPAKDVTMEKRPMISAPRKSEGESERVNPLVNDVVSREAIEKVCREVIPPLAEKIIREEIKKILDESE